MTSLVETLTFDSRDPEPVARFWCTALGYQVTDSDTQGVWIEDPAGRGWPILFLVVPEDKSIKNRLHLDLSPPTTMAQEVERLVDAGATVVERVDEGGSTGPCSPTPRATSSACCAVRTTTPRGSDRCEARGRGRMSKVTTMQDAVRDLVRDGDTVAIEGFTHLICFAAGHEIIRQRRRDLTLARMTPDVVYDQMIGAGVASKLIFSWMGNPGVGNLHAVRRRIEKADPEPLEIEEYSHFGMVCRYMAGAANLPFFPIRSYYESDIPTVNPKIVPMTSPYDPNDEVYVVPPLKPDVAIVAAQRADAEGDTQIWGLLGCQKEVAFAARKVIVVVEEVVEESTIRQDPNRTVIPGAVVDAVVEEPFACHPSFTQGYYDRDNAFYLEWDRIAKDPATLEAWYDEWVYGLANHREYVEKFGDAYWDRLRPTPAPSGEVDYGRYA